MSAALKENVNIVHHLDNLSLGPWNRRNQFLKQIGKIVVERHIGKLECFEDTGAKFNRRITSIVWHPKHPLLYAVASKFGDIVFGSAELSPIYGGDLSLLKKVEVKGSGPGGSITAMKFDENESTILYRTSIDSKVVKLDLLHSSKNMVFKDTDNYEHWFTAMDVNFHSKVLAAGDNKGFVHLFDLNGKEQGTYRLHKNKIHWAEFSKKDPNLMVTAPLADTGSKSAEVKIWDIRKLNFLKPLFSLPHDKGVNVASFNPLDGSKLLTSDQESEIRVYQGPFWENVTTIKHWHKQFQHMTPIKPAWHPLHDLIVTGNYPKNPAANEGPITKRSTVERLIQFFDAETGNQVGEISHPLNLIVSLNVFNPTGEFLASSMSSELVLWRPGTKLETLEGNQHSQSQTEDKGSLSQSMKNLLRGKRNRETREFSPVDDEDDENDEKDKKKTKRPRKVPASSSTSSTSTVRGRGSRSRTVNSATDTKKSEKEGKGKKRK